MLSPSEIEEAIIGYLTRRPGSGDTLQGIAQWWIPAQRIEAELTTVADILARLVREGVLERHEHAGAEPVYRIGPNNTRHEG